MTRQIVEPNGSTHVDVRLRELRIRERNEANVFIGSVNFIRIYMHSYC
jgi:hypothetical protein